MKKIKSNKSIIAGLAIIAFISISASNSLFEISKNLDIFNSLYKELNTYYVDDIEPSKLIKTGIDAMLEELDPYTNFIPESDVEGYRLQTTGKYGGIGSVISSRDGQVYVSEPYEGFPAQRAGLKAGDIFISVDGKSVKDKNTKEVSSVLKGQPGTTVDVIISRLQSDGNYKEMKMRLDREEIKIKNVPHYSMINKDVGYIKLAHFTQNAAEEVREAVQRLREDKQAKSIVLDLRGNPGGLLKEAVNITNVFVKKGQEIVRTKGKIKDWNKSFVASNVPETLDLPLVVLTNNGSASASEIVSGCIQDLDRGVVVGQRTFGKGLVQSTRSLPYGSKLKLTTAKYYIPSGRCIQAINYAEKDKDGNIQKMPDSLKTAFKTRNGRTVYDGTGINPDIVLKEKEYSNITLSLLTKNLIFDFATQYTSKHPSIKSVEQFELTDKDFKDFMAYIANKDYTYQTESELILKELKDAAEKEKYFDAIAQDFSSLEKRISVDKKQDVIKHKKEIVELIENEIVSRYYYQAGRIKHAFKYDTEIQEAVNLLAKPNKYNALLQP